MALQCTGDLVIEGISLHFEHYLGITSLNSGLMLMISGALSGSMPALLFNMIFAIGHAKALIQLPAAARSRSTSIA